MVDSVAKSEQSDRAVAEEKSLRHRRRAGVEALQRKVYSFGDLAGYSLRDRLLIRFADLAFYYLIRIICSTMRWEVRGGENLEAIYAKNKRAIFTFWHACIFSATWLWRNRGIVVMSSTSRDSEYVARLIQRFGYGASRGSSTRGWARALAEMDECLDTGLDVGFTIDGPRGPAYVAKSGAVTLARHSGHLILPFHITHRRYLEIPSWDRQQLPLPFTRALALVSQPIAVPRDATAEQIEAKQAELQGVLDRLREEGERWRRA